MGKEKALLQVKGSTFRAMESVHEKLKCLNYGYLFVKELKQSPVSKDEFILPPMKNTGQQFSHYIQLIKWLLSLIVNSKNDDNIDIDEHSLLPSVTAASEFDKVDIYDDPNVIAQKLMLTLRELGYNMDFPITKLKQPYGEIATSVLNFLADMALHCKKFQFIVEPKYITSKKLNEEEEEDDDNNHSDQEEIIVTDEETFEDSNDSIELSYEITKFENDATNNKFTSHSQPTQAMISCNIDPIEWRTEVERVTPALEVQFDDNYENNDTTTSTTTSLLQNDISNNSWRKQVINALTENEKIWSEMERSQAAFQRLSKESNRSLEMIGIKEQIINDKFKHITEEYKICCCNVVDLEEKRKESSTTLNEMNGEITSLSKKLHSVKSKVDEKGNMMTDTSPLIRIKTTLKEIKAEIRDYDLQIGILEHNLVQRRLAKVNT